MALLSRLARFFSGRLTAEAAARQLVVLLKSAAPTLPWQIDHGDPCHPRIAVPGRWILTLEDCREGARATLAEPGQPGRDLPPFLLRAPYHIKNMIPMLAAKALMAPGRVVIYWLRPDAVYEIARGFTDHHGNVFAAGSRLTFRERHYLPYHGGHTLLFHEATVYLQDDDEVCRNFELYFVAANAP